MQSSTKDNFYWVADTKNKKEKQRCNDSEIARVDVNSMWSNERASKQASGGKRGAVSKINIKPAIGAKGPQNIKLKGMTVPITTNY